MLKAGIKQKLTVVSRQDFGIYLAESEGAERDSRVLLPAKQVPEGTEIGDRMEVFLYRDSQDRLIATTREPVLQLGQTAVLTVKEVSKIGAFLDWGLEKDLFLPFREQTAKVRAGDEILAALYTDKSGRLCATMKVYHYLKTNPPYIIGDEVKGRVYEISRNFGVFVAVDDMYSALIPKRDAQGIFVPGQILDLRVTEVKEDGKLSVTAKKKAYQQIGIDAEMIIDRMHDLGGELPFDDKASPEMIDSMFGISKAAFKRAVGHLLKEKLVKMENGRLILR